MVCSEWLITGHRGLLSPETLRRYVVEWASVACRRAAGVRSAAAPALADIDLRPASMEPTWLVAERDGATAGLIAGAIGGDGRGTVHALVVDEAVRRQGIGSRLLDEMTVSQRQMGLTEQQVMIHDGNAAAVGFFTRYGFRPGEPFELHSGDQEIDGVRRWWRQLDPWSW